MSGLQKNVSLKPYNTFGIAVNASCFIEITDEADLRSLFENSKAKSKKILILGGGSNILFTRDFEGLVVKMSIPGIHYSQNGSEIYLTAGAGVVWNDLVNFCVAREIGGIENLTLIPGTVGASPIQNIGAYGVELKDVFHSCSAFEIASGLSRTFLYEDCHFGYRESVFKNGLKGKFIITSVTFKLSKQTNLKTQYGAITDELQKRNITRPGIADISRVVADIRVNKLPDPSTIGNAGSFFKNPILDNEKFETLIQKFPDMVHFPAPGSKTKLAAGWLIEQCGFKGKVQGQTGTWKNQALVLVNHGTASGEEVYNFSEQIIKSVSQKFGLTLCREVNIL